MMKSNKSGKSGKYSANQTQNQIQIQNHTKNQSPNKASTTQEKHKLIALTLAALIFSFIFTTPSILAQTFTIQYDANGNRVSDGTYYYEYNNFNQLSRVRLYNSTGTILEEYRYDQDGNRIYKYEPQINQKTYYFDKSFVRVVNSSGVYDSVYYYDQKDLVARKDLWNNKTYFYHPDHLGSTTLITNQSGNTVTEMTYEPYGKVYSGSTNKSKYLYTGKELDNSTGLYYYGARYYSPTQAQFVQPDSNLPNIYDPQQLNRYSYVRNNPYKYTDPDGNELSLGAIAIAAAVFIALTTVAGIVTAAISSAIEVSQGKITVNDAIVNIAAGGAGGAAFGATIVVGTAIGIFSGNPEIIGAAGIAAPAVAFTTSQITKNVAYGRNILYGVSLESTSIAASESLTHTPPGLADVYNSEYPSGSTYLESTGKFDTIEGELRPINSNAPPIINNQHLANGMNRITSDEINKASAIPIINNLFCKNKGDEQCSQ